MTIDELRQQLDDLKQPGNTQIVVTNPRDNENASPLAHVTPRMYAADNTRSGSLYMTREQRAATDDADDYYAEAPDDAVIVVALEPTN